MKLAGIILSAWLLTGCCCCCGGGSGGIVTDPNSGKIQVVNGANKKQLELLRYDDVAGSYGGVNIEGDVKNVSGEDLSSVYIAFTLRDKKGNVIGMVNDALFTTLPKGETWHFKCDVYQDNVDSYTLSDLH